MAIPGYKLTPEFAEAVSSGNLVRTRIMLKDSMLLDPSGEQFSRMLDHAKRKFPDIIVPHDGERLEPDPAKWDRELMNLELVQLVNNFSHERIEHLWRVIRVELADKIRMQRLPEQARPSAGTAVRPGSNPIPKFSISIGGSADERKQNRLNALKGILAAIRQINQVSLDAKYNKGWNAHLVARMKQYAQDILNAAEEYENNI